VAQSVRRCEVGAKRSRCRFWPTGAAVLGGARSNLRARWPRAIAMECMGTAKGRRVPRARLASNGEESDRHARQFVVAST
jgi:hypothetical protein